MDHFLEEREFYKKSINPLIRNKYGTPDNFTTDTGIKIRRVIHKPIKNIFKFYLEHFEKKKIVLHAVHDNYQVLDYFDKSIVEKERIKAKVRTQEAQDIEGRYPKLEKDTPYIFTSTHLFTEDVAAVMTCIDRPVYIFIGSNDQLTRNIDLYAAWAAGLIAVDITSPQSRKESFLKMKRIIDSGSSVLIFPEGSYNHTENKLVKQLYSGVYNLARATEAEVVPIAPFHTPKLETGMKYFNDLGRDEIYVSFGNALYISEYDEMDNGLTVLRDELARLQLNHIVNYTNELKREDLLGDIHYAWMEYFEELMHKMNWGDNTDWYEELLTRKTDEELKQLDAFSFMKDFNKGYTDEMGSYERERVLNQDKYDMSSYLTKSLKFKKNK